MISRGVVYADPSSAPAVEELAADPSGPREVLVRVHACGLCHSDLHVVETGGWGMRFPILLGHEGAGCGTPQGDTVLWLEDGVVQCATVQPLGVSAVEFEGIVRRPRGWYARHTTSLTIGGVLVRREADGVVRGSHEVVLVLPRRGLAVAVLGPRRALIGRIVRSLRAVARDVNGCVAQTPSGGYRLGTRPSASASFVPAGASRVSACSYQGRWLDASNLFGRRGASHLARDLDTAAYGFSRAPRGSYLPSVCSPSWHGSLITARFEYPRHRRPVIVTAHLDGCNRLGASNGRWAVQTTPHWVRRLSLDARYSGAFPDPRIVRPD